MQYLQICCILPRGSWKKPAALLGLVASPRHPSSYLPPLAPPSPFYTILPPCDPSTLPPDPLPPPSNLPLPLPLPPTKYTTMAPMEQDGHEVPRHAMDKLSAKSACVSNIYAIKCVQYPCVSIRMCIQVRYPTGRCAYLPSVTRYRQSIKPLLSHERPGWCYPTGRCAYLPSVTCYRQSIKTPLLLLLLLLLLLRKGAEKASVQV